jgi:hypothetical protein
VPRSERAIETVQANVYTSYIYTLGANLYQALEDYNTKNPKRKIRSVEDLYVENSLKLQLQAIKDAKESFRICGPEKCDPEAQALRKATFLEEVRCLGPRYLPF